MKLCTPESSLFKGSPGISFGIYNLGFKDDVSNYNVLHLMFQKAFPKGGYFAAGVYHGLNRHAHDQQRRQRRQDRRDDRRGLARHPRSVSKV